MTSCTHTYRTKAGEFTSKSTSITLYVQNVYLALQMSPLQHNIDITIDGTKAKLPGHIYTIDRSGLVDLGLSGILWSDRNVGAENVWDYGGYFAWGETTTNGNYSAGSVRYVPAEDRVTKYCTSYDYWSGGGDPDNKTQLDVEDDAAYAQNTAWHMPTRDEMTALVLNCYWEWTDKYEGHTIGDADASGYIVYMLKSDADKDVVVMYEDTPKVGYSTSADTHIFLPAAGIKIGTGYGEEYSSPGTDAYYWTATLGFSPYVETDDPYIPLSGSNLHFDKLYNEPSANWYSRYSGQSVRAVRRSN